MKKAILSLICASAILSAAAQETTDKKVQAGIAYQFGLNFNKPGTKNIERNGVGVQNSIGLTANFKLTDNIAFSTGLEFDFESFKYRISTAIPVYYNYKDTKILQKEEDETGSSLYHLTERKYKTTYLTIPTMLLFRTNPIGDFRYYGKFGARTSFLVKSVADDQGFMVNGGIQGGTETSFENNGMKTPGDLFFLRSTVGIGGGAEWNFTGNTSLYAEAAFYYGFTPVHYGKAVTGNDDFRDATLYTSGANNGTGNDEYFLLKANQKQIVIKIGILF